MVLGEYQASREVPYPGLRLISDWPKYSKRLRSGLIGSTYNARSFILAESRIRIWGSLNIGRTDS